MSVGENRRGAAEAEAASPFYIPAADTPAYEPRTLKAGDTFAVLDPFGDAQAAHASAEGLYHNDTRHLSQLALLVDGRRPLLLSSRVTEDNAALVIDLTNPDVFEGGELRLPRDTVHTLRAKTLVPGGCVECLKLQNYDTRPVELSVTLHLAADFADIFEVRGTRRRLRDEPLAPRPTSRGVVLSYVGRDGVVRRTRIVCEPLPTLRSDAAMTWRVRLGPHEVETIHVRFDCEAGREIASSWDIT